MPAVTQDAASILTASTLDPAAVQSSASIAHPWWSGDDLSPAASTNAFDLGLTHCQSAGAISINPAFVKPSGSRLWAMVRRISLPKNIARRSSTASTATHSSRRSMAASFAARSCPYSACNHAVCNRR